MRDKPGICRMVWYRSRTGAYTVPAVINCTVDTLYLPAVEVGYIPALSSPTHVHLTVFSPGIPQLGPNSANPFKGKLGDGDVQLPPGAVSHNLSGTYQEWDVPFFNPDDHGEHRYVSCKPQGFDNPYQHLVQNPGTWTWPEIR